MVISWEEVQKARQRLAREQGTVIKDWGGQLPVALVYPNSYFVGMSNLGVHAVYRLLNRQPDVVCERVFWENTPLDVLPISLETQKPLTDFAIIAFSVSYELDYFNIVQILKASGIPLYAKDRDETQPLIIGGGPCVMANPLPVAPFFDALCNGEAEAILPAILPVAHEKISYPRAELLEALAAIPGVFVPQKPPRHVGVARQIARDLDDSPVTTAIITPDTELGDLYLIEVERGCAWHCRFCLACSIFFPMRVHSLDMLVKLAEEGLRYRKRLGLVGADISDYPYLDELVARLREMGAEVSASSLRIKPLSSALLREMARGTDSVALAPEAGSQRLRDVIRKGIGDDDILAAIEQVAQEGIKQLKLYFMVGLPSEEDEDVAEIVQLVSRAKQTLEKRGSRCRISLNVSSFVPKAGTPFQWLPMAPLKTLERRLGMLKSGLESKGIQVKGESPIWSEVQAVLAAGDERLAPVLAGLTKLSPASFRQALKQHGLDLDSCAHRARPLDRPLPWAVIDHGTSLEKLRDELTKALAATA